MNIGSRRAGLAAALSMLLAVLWADARAHAAQAYPDKPVRLIVPAAPSGGLDIMARVVGHSLTTMLGQQVIVDNRPGAGVLIGTEIASQATPDGYTLLVDNANLASNAILHDKVSLTRELSPITLLANLPEALSVPASLPVTSVKELIALAKSSHLTYGSAGYGTVGNICTEMLKLATGVHITHVPYKGGGPVMAALAGGQISMSIVSLASTIPQMKAGRVKILAVTGSRRARAAPDIPTIAETIPGVVLQNWIGLLAPAGVPEPIIRQLNTDVRKVIGMPDVKRGLEAKGYEIEGSTPQQFGALIQGDVTKYTKVIREAHIRIN